MSERSKRKGWMRFVLCVSKAFVNPLIVGVLGLALKNGSPGGLSAKGYVPKKWSKEQFSG